MRNRVLLTIFLLLVIIIPFVSFVEAQEPNDDYLVYLPIIFAPPPPPLELSYEIVDSWTQASFIYPYPCGCSQNGADYVSQVKFNVTANRPLVNIASDVNVLMRDNITGRTATLLFVTDSILGTSSTSFDARVCRCVYPSDTFFDQTRVIGLHDYEAIQIYDIEGYFED